ncbi:hypothetical protein MKK88_04560 [Methylobacterium sp. E-005]|uniref:hypothetical protein n=1 Tax=Methylobacterium sp. E-005 TaxID=2836549 RepID=UPI001FBC0221|nr:hypothetical protein [Methylobacterium sp. E-005]MCJ2085268.1 hypothetical protein [Methylobacterium sp. E-005]
MRAPLGILAASGWRLRAAFGLAGLAVVGVQSWPVAIDAPPPRVPPAPAAPAEGSALRRPLFDPSRQAWTAAGSRDLILRPDPVPPVLVLRGIRRDGAAARAFIDDGSGDPAWLAPGEGRGDWRIVAIGADRVTVTQRGRLFEAVFLGEPATLRPTPFADRPVDVHP